MEFAREDWLLVVIVAAIAIPLGYSMMDSDEFTPDTELERYCADLADAVEQNVTFADQLRGCECVPPEKLDESRFTAPRKVENATKLLMVSCTFKNGQKQLFPVRRIHENYTGDINRTNASLLRDSPQ